MLFYLIFLVNCHLLSTFETMQQFGTDFEKIDLATYQSDLMIINGTVVLNGEANYQLALLRNGRFICSAVLLSPQTALGVAHCFYG